MREQKWATDHWLHTAASHRPESGRTCARISLFSAFRMIVAPGEFLVLFATRRASLRQPAAKLCSVVSEFHRPFLFISPALPRPLNALFKNSIQPFCNRTARPPNNSPSIYISRNGFVSRTRIRNIGMMLVQIAVPQRIVER